MLGSSRCLLLVALLTLAGCRWDTPSELDLTTLDTGRYSSRPLIAPTHGSEYHGRILESVRMMEAVAVPADIDPALTRHGVVIPLATPPFAMVTLSDVMKPVLEKHNMMAGVATTGDDAEAYTADRSKQRTITLNILRFRDEETARQAARELDAADFTVSAENVAVDIPGYPGAHSHWRPSVPTLGATVAHGVYVVVVYVGQPSIDLTALTATARAAFDRQLALLDTFEPTPTDRIATLPVDSDGMLARMIPARTGRWSYPAIDFIAFDELMVSGVVLGPRAAGVGQMSAAQRAELGWDRQALVGWGNTLDRLRDPEAARRYAAMVAESRSTDEPLTAPPIPETTCFRAPLNEKLPITRFVRHSCVLTYDRYVAIVYGADDDDVRRKTAAQYALLRNTR
ncbi:hypothetical protein JK358_25880 [Nocardia sp. 2]|uniref:Uncharacterized protein n=1 Tax=Nocardia acididurans TaxID=2802282 RepID=A0ABS1MB22_9NOCA|nr:hypothetical protein [Nocardia acididurans]MBL1077838.1 hypothetical protein [Nocardia acididurans]